VKRLDSQSARRSDAKERRASSKPAEKPPSNDAALARHALSLPGSVLRELEKRGIYCMPSVSLEHQQLARRYVLRAVESGGAVEDMGRVCAYVTAEGQPLSWLQSIDAISANGRHAIFIAQTLVRLEMMRTGKTYELAITLHCLSEVSPGRRPTVVSHTLFRGRDGHLPVDLWKHEHRRLRGLIAPAFYSRSGEEAVVPDQFEEPVRKLTAAVCCVGCKHSHLGIAPKTEIVP
jgi:hypothetical protein